MMKSKNFIMAIIFLVSIFIANNHLLSQEDKIVLPKTGHRKPPILFDHKAHSEDYEAKCIDCHHKGKNQKCSDPECHLVRDKGNVINLKGAYHQQCHDCHRKKSGPKACSRCHKRSKSK